MKKEKLLLFGIGQLYKDFSKLVHTKFDVVGLIDNDKNKQGYVVEQLEIKPPESLQNMKDDEYDKVIIVPLMLISLLEVFNQLQGLRVSFEKIDKVFLNRGKICIPQKEIIEGKLVLKYNGIKLFIENVTDLLLFNEVIVLKAYETTLLKNSNYVVIDIGANVADTALYFSSVKNIMKVYAYELFKSIHNKGLENLKINPELSRKIEYNNFGISNINQELFISDVYINEMGAGINTSFKKGADKVIVRNVAEIFQNIRSKRKHNEEIILKMDCEGAEYEILSKLESENMLNKIDTIIMEWHVVSTHTKISEPLEFLKDILERNGFRFYKVSRYANIGMLCAYNFRGGKL